MARRVATLLGSLVLVALGVASMITAELGVAPYDVLSTGLSELAGIPIGVAAVILPVAFVAAGHLLGRRLAFGTVLCTVLVGPMIGLFLALLPELDAMAPRLGLYGVGLVVLACGITGTIVADLGAGPAELIMLAIHDRGPAIAPVRTAIEVACVLGGWAMGGQVGVGTVVFALVIGTLLRLLLTAAGFSPQAAAAATDLAAPGA